MYGALGISERETRGVVCATCVGQRPASGPGTVHSFYQLSRSPVAVKRSLQPVSEKGERLL